MFIDKEKLSKHKHIYVLTCDDERAHAQKFPIIYINQEYVYYRVNGAPELERARTSAVKENIDGIDFTKLNRYSHRVYLWDLPEDFMSKNKEYMNQARKERLQNELLRARQKYEVAKRVVSDLEQKCKEMEAIIDSDGLA